ncbi:MAG: hypothetical protein PF795_05995 [Kiritimatiellae bacterium]|jgi:uncharacterized protein with PQ loop repeat|nr:hypothetical protein [Kiritimatiellia bacterium]
MRESLINLSGWIPAIILPLATLFQLVKIASTRSAKGVSILTWLLFGIANIGLYIFTEKYTHIQSIMGQLLTSILNFVIVGWILVLRKREPPSREAGIGKFGK